MRPVRRSWGQCLHLAEEIGLAFETNAWQVGHPRCLAIQNVNANHSRFKQWLRRFSGVATSYLPNYLG